MGYVRPCPVDTDHASWEETIWIGVGVSDVPPIPIVVGEGQLKLQLGTISRREARCQVGSVFDAARSGRLTRSHGTRLRLGR